MGKKIKEGKDTPIGFRTTWDIYEKIYEMAKAKRLSQTQVFEQSIIEFWNKFKGQKVPIEEIENLIAACDLMIMNEENEASQTAINLQKKALTELLEKYK